MQSLSPGDRVQIKSWRGFGVPQAKLPHFGRLGPRLANSWEKYKTQ
jgi:hypothetical protein